MRNKAFVLSVMIVVCCGADSLQAGGGFAPNPSIWRWLGCGWSAGYHAGESANGGWSGGGVQQGPSVPQYGPHYSRQYGPAPTPAYGPSPEVPTSEGPNPLPDPTTGGPGGYDRAARFPSPYPWGGAFPYRAW